jgi:hypothetical protein
MNNLFIPFKIDSEEKLVRIIFNPLHYSVSKKRFNREAFLPPPGRDDVSMIRLNYSSPNRCKEIADTIKLKDNKHIGYSISDMSKFLNKVLSKPDPFNKVTIRATPLPKHLEIDFFGYFFTLIYNVPEHADMIYPYKPEKNKSNPELRLFVEDIISIFTFCEKETDLNL